MDKLRPDRLKSTRLIVRVQKKNKNKYISNLSIFQANFLKKFFLGSREEICFGPPKSSVGTVYAYIFIFFYVFTIVEHFLKVINFFRFSNTIVVCHPIRRPPADSF